MATQALNIPAHLKGRDFLTMAELTTQDVMDLLNLARQLKEMKKKGIPHRLLEGKSVALYFEKPSNRTRVSFEVGVNDLGAHPINLRKEEINLGVRETIADTARTLARYVDGIMIRTFAQKDVDELAEWSSVPVINGLTDEHHPCQGLADILTVYERFGDFKGRKLTYIGDGNNVAHSLLIAGAMVGMDVTIACPSGYEPMPQVMKAAQKFADQTGAVLSVTDDVMAAAKDASAVYTDVWASMGQEAESEARKKLFKNYQVNDAVMGVARPDAIVLHCLPAHRGDEITHEVLERYADSIFDQAENRLHAQKAVMAAML